MKNVKKNKYFFVSKCISEIISEHLMFFFFLKFLIFACKIELLWLTEAWFLVENHFLIFSVFNILITVTKKRCQFTISFSSYLIDIGSILFLENHVIMVRVWTCLRIIVTIVIRAGQEKFVQWTSPGFFRLSEKAIIFRYEKNVDQLLYVQI